jgi:hypothetical protein
LTSSSAVGESGRGRAASRTPRTLPTTRLRRTAWRRSASPWSRAAPSARPAGCRSSRERWQAWLTDDEPPELAFYRPECAELEFGDD